MTLVADRTEPYDKQAAFNIAWHHAVTNKMPKCSDEKAGFASPTCRYRSEDGDNACLVGILIPDMTYNEVCVAKQEKILSGSIHSLMTKFPVILTILDRCLLQFYIDLQQVHDSPAPSVYRRTIKRSLKAFADKHGLTIPN